MPKRNLELFMPVVDAIAGTFGSNCEVVLHDFSKPHQSIIKIANGHVTNRAVGGPITDLGLSFIERHMGTKDILVGYPTQTKNGTKLKSTTVFIRNSKGKIIGALCINIAISTYLSMKNMIEELCSTTTLSNEAAEDKSPEKFENSVDVLINELIDEAVNEIGKPVAQMEKKDKLRILGHLKKKGLFLIKGSAKRVSQELAVSLPTIYKYLEEI